MGVATRRGPYQAPEDAESDVRTKLGVMQQRLQPVGFGLGQVVAVAVGDS